MSALVLGLATEQPVTVDDAGFIDTSFPGFAGADEPAAGGALAAGVIGARSSSPSTAPPPPARARWRGASPPTLGLPYLDTGLLYRAVGRRVLDAGGDPADPAAAEAAARACARPTWLAPTCAAPTPMPPPRGRRHPGGARRAAGFPARLRRRARRGAGWPRHRHRDLPGRTGEAVRHRQPWPSGRAAVGWNCRPGASRPTRRPSRPRCWRATRATRRTCGAAADAIVLDTTHLDAEAAFARGASALQVRGSPASAVGFRLTTVSTASGRLIAS